MAVKIGHASIDENGKAKNGKAGDQTGREVCTRTWYNKGWVLVLRPKAKELAEKSAVACEKGCANKNIGYDKNQRNTAHTQAKAVGYDLSKIKTPCETDCSAFMTLCAIAAGVKELEYTGNAPTTSTMKEKFKATGKYDVLTDSKYLTSDKYLKRGDILVKPGSHTVMVLENGSAVGEKTSYSEPTRTLYYKKPTFISGDDVKWVQERLIKHGCLPVKNSKDESNVDGYYGRDTYKAVIKFQKKVGIEVDGKVGRITRNHLKAD